MKKIEQTLNIIFSSSRRMPAHVSSNGDRTQSFCLDFDLLTKEDDEDMAAQSWGSIDNFIDNPLPGIEYRLIVKCGEENMIGSYVLTKLGGEDRLNELQQIINEDFDENSNSFHPNIKSLFTRENVIRYLNYCRDYGYRKALSKK